MVRWDPEKRSPRRWYRWGLLIVSLVGFIWLLVVVRPILLPFILALVLAYLMAPLVDLLARYGLDRAVAILLVYSLVGLVITALVIYMVPVLLQESVRLIKYVPTLAQGVQSTWDYWLTRFHQQPMPPAIRSAITGTGKHLQNRLSTGLKGILHTVFGLVPGVLSVIIAPVLGFYVLKDLDRIRERVWAIVPVDWQGAVYKLGFDIDRALNGYIRGQLMVALVVGVLSALWTFILGIPFAPLIGAVAAVTDVIPYVGPIAGAIPAILLGLTRSPFVSMYAVIGFVVIHQLEGTVISPKVVGESVGLHPLVVIFAIFAGGAIGGFAGLLIGVPAAAVLKVVLAHLYRRLTVPLDHKSAPSVQ
ncbi:AI-2E family transporter [Sulfobacillus harzensis]|uniref:AI-2E family transporter n=1 Tax=Sulfobacillus harzensis TaxID=2729629 RepID=A0A7Y0L375_9FIRM|nr:AI-2E family transporter [Sulfobacillus harzensis]NMP22484.1 AI-2E family transporter [Sulfobacillus harzensis]